MGLTHEGKQGKHLRKIEKGMQTLINDTHWWPIIDGFLSMHYLGGFERMHCSFYISFP